MKKMLSITLATALMMSFATTAFAESANIANTTSSQNIDVKAKYVDTSSTPDVYSVDIAWDAMEFTFTKSGTKDWQVNDHSYEDNTTTTWSKSNNTVIVTNHSNAEVTTSFSFEALDTYSSVTGTFDVQTKTLSAGVVGGYESADSVVSKLTLEGTLASNVGDFTKIGTITVKIN